jgi:hypothetical protein
MHTGTASVDSPQLTSKKTSKRSSKRKAPGAAIMRRPQRAAQTPRLSNDARWGAQRRIPATRREFMKEGLRKWLPDSISWEYIGGTHRSVMAGVAA